MSDDAEAAGPREFLRGVETRLDRALAAGWRSAAGDLAAFDDQADLAEAFGLTELAVRLRAVRLSASPAALLRTATLAATTCQLIRAHLPLATRANLAAEPLTMRRRRSPDPELLLPLCRLAMDGREYWSCLRSRGFAVEWVLATPDGITVRPGVWLRQPLHGHLQWSGRVPLGTDRDVQIQTILEPSWESAQPTAIDPHAAFRKRLAAGKLKEDKLPVWGGGSIQLTPLDPEKAGAALWLDAAIAREIGGGKLDDVWALIWEHAEVAAVVAVMAERGLLRKTLKVVHLVPGCPVDDVE